MKYNARVAERITSGTKTEVVEKIEEAPRKNEVEVTPIEKLSKDVELKFGPIKSNVSALSTSVPSLASDLEPEFSTVETMAMDDLHSEGMGGTGGTKEGNKMQCKMISSTG